MANPIRVAQILGKMNGGGVEAVVMNYYRHIDRSKVQFDFLVDSDSTLVPREEIESLGGRVFEIPPYQHVVEYQRELQRLFKQEGWKIVHSHINALSVFSLRAAKKAGVPVRIAHSHSTSGKGEHAKNVLKSILKTQANRYPTKRIACSNLAGDWLFGKNASFTVVGNAVDLSDFVYNENARRTIRSELGLSNNALLVGHLGRFAEQKNHAFLLEVFREVLAYVPDAVLAMAGDGPLLEATKKRATELGIKDSVRFLGTRMDAPALYQAFDVFCLPSLYEGLPVVGVECQASGTPILVSNAVTGETKITSLLDFESLDASPVQWAKHLLSMRGRMLSSQDLEALSDFDVRVAAGRLENLYEQYLEEVVAL